MGVVRGVGAATAWPPGWGASRRAWARPYLVLVVRAWAWETGGAYIGARCGVNSVVSCVVGRTSTQL